MRAAALQRKIDEDKIAAGILGFVGCQPLPFLSGTCLIPLGFETATALRWCRSDGGPSRLWPKPKLWGAQQR